MSRLGKIDPNSYAEPEKVIIKHIDLFWNINFTNQTISGKAIYKLKVQSTEIDKILLDVLDINITSVAYQHRADSFPINYFISDLVKGIGSKLTIELPTPTKDELIIVIEYETSPKAAALQWLTPEQTLGKKHPYLFSQCQAIQARSLIPCQDTPAVKFTYSADVTHPVELTALLSGNRREQDNRPGFTKYEQGVPIPSYLLAIAVGEIVSRRLGEHSKVWAEEAIVDEAAEEFSETSRMLQTAIDICGPYVWKDYDLLVMPPSFPFGGMENPCLTFVTPTLLAGDKSLANVVAHEISHSWTGNLVTNQNFEHFWLNEGFTMFVEGKITGRMQGDLTRDFQALEGLNDLRDCLKNQLADEPALTKLVVDLSGVSPEDAFSSVPYMKGQNFLRYLEDLLGGPTTFDPFLKSYLHKFQYQSIKTDDFKAYLYQYFKEERSAELEQVDWDLWLYGEGMPPVIPKYNTELADVAYRHATLWTDKPLAEITTSPIISEHLTTLQKITFLSKLVEVDQIHALSAEWIALLATTYNIGRATKNCELRFRFLRLCIKARLFERMDEIIEFANSNFRMKYVRPIYRDLAQWPEAKGIAIDNFNKVKDQMMDVCANQVAKDLGIK